MDCLIGRPYEPVCLDTLLMFYDRYDQKLITVVDIRNDQCMGRFATEGKGPGEVLPPLRLYASSKDKKLYALGRNQKCVYVFHVPGLKMEPKIQIQGNPSDMRKMKDSFVGVSAFQKGRFQLYDLEGNFIQAAGEYPFRGKEMEEINAFIPYQGNLCASPDGNYFAIGSIPIVIIWSFMNTEKGRQYCIKNMKQ